MIFNKVGSSRHAEMLRQVCDDLQVSCLGCVPTRKSLEQHSRYLGLDFSVSPEHDELVELLDENVRWERLLQL